MARAFLLLGGEATHGSLYGLLRPPGERGEAFDENGEVLTDELFTELFLELGLVVIEGTAVEVSDRVGDLGRQGDALLEEVHDLPQPRLVQLFFGNRARLEEHGGSKRGEFLGTL